MPEVDQLAAERAALVRVAAALATRRPEQVEQALVAAANEAEPTAVEEVLLQSHLFVGFPDALEAMVVWRRASGSLAPAPYPEEPELWTSRGAQVCATVYAANYEKLRRNVTALHPELDRWMVEGGYGRVIGRPGLDLATRELCVAALLAVWNAPRQLHSHLRGALNAGASATDVAAALEIAFTFMDAAATAAVRVLWQAISDARAE